MKKIGIIGGLGPEATLDYYKEIIKVFNAESKELIYPDIIIYSVNMSEFIGLMKAQKYTEATSYLIEKIQALKNAGADFAAIGANTPHLMFDQLQKASPIPLISIVEETCEQAIKKGSKRVGLFGTAFTMNTSFYADVFKRKGIEVVVPDESDRELINVKLFSEIELGIFKEDTRQMLIGIMEKMVREKHIDSLILGCTEFPLILTENQYAGIPVFNTTKIHVDAIIKRCKE